MKNWRTSLAAIIAAIGMIPSAISYLNLQVVPQWLITVGLVSTFIAYIAQGLLAKDKNVTGVGEDAKTKAELNQ